MSSNAHPLPELNEIHLKWIANLQKDNPDLPVGYARAIVELYVSKPDLFTKQTVDQWAAEKPPLMHTTNGEVRVLTPEESKEFEAKLPPAEAETVCEAPVVQEEPPCEIQSTVDADNANNFVVTDRTDGNEVQL